MALAYHLALQRLFPVGAPPGKVFDVVVTACNWGEFRANFPNWLRDARPITRVDPEAYRSSEIKRRFDYNFNLNSFAILGDVMRTVNANGPAPTKVGVQTLYLAREVGPREERELIDRMEEWKGTERYAEEPGVGLGSITSRASIVERLVDASLFDKKGRVRWLSDKGRYFLDLLHPGCRDPDLPLRIEEWSRLPREEAFPKVDRYIRTFFAARSGSPRRGCARLPGRIVSAPFGEVSTELIMRGGPLSRRMRETSSPKSSAVRDLKDPACGRAISSFRLAA